MILKKAGIVLIIILLFWTVRSLPKSRQDQKTIFVAGKQLAVETASSPAQRERGLSDQENLCWDCGLLFVFDQPGIYPFWMKRMHFDIDILWLAENKVVEITSGAKKPAKEEFDQPKEIYQNKIPVDQVLEVNSGWVAENGIRIGDEIRFDSN